MARKPKPTPESSSLSEVPSTSVKPSAPTAESAPADVKPAPRRLGRKAAPAAPEVIVPPVVAPEPVAPEPTAVETVPAAESAPVVPPIKEAATKVAATPKPRARRGAKTTAVALVAADPIVSVPVIEAPVATAASETAEPKASFDMTGLEEFAGFITMRSRTARPTVEQESDEEPVPTGRSAAPKRLGRRDVAPSVDPPKASPKPKVDLGPAPEFDMLGYAQPTWRALADRPAGTDLNAREESESPEFDDTGEPRRNRRGGRGRRDEIPADAVVEIESKSLGAVQARAPKPFIDAPLDAPQIILREGVPTLVHEGRVVTPFALYVDVAQSSRREDVAGEIRMAAEAGVHLFVLPVRFHGTKDSVAETAATISEAVAQVLAADPAAKTLVRLRLEAPRGWENAFGEAAYRSRDGKTAPPSIADDRYWDSVRASLSDLVGALAEVKSLVGLQFDRDGWEIVGGYDSSPAAAEGFRKWLRERYLNDDVMLRAAWFDGEADFETAEAPTRSAPRKSESVRFIRAERRGRRYVDTHLFLSDITVHRIADLAYAVKEASGGRLLFGTRYGDTFESVHPARGQLSLGKLLRTPEVDFLTGPPSGEAREPGASAGMISALDSITLNGKLYLTEGDYRTSLGGDHPSDAQTSVRSPQTLENLHSRDLGLALAHDGGAMWMDRDGRGALNTASVWKRAEGVRKALDLALATPNEAPEVAVFLDERALAYLDDHAAFGALVRATRDAVLRAGVSAGFYLLSDLAHRERFPESKLYIFLNAWDIRADLRSAIKTRLQRDGKVLFFPYTAGLFDGGRDSLERVREVTGIALRPQPFASRAGTTLVDRRHPLAAAFGGSRIESYADLEPSYAAIPEDATVLGEYSATGLPSFVVRHLPGEAKGLDWTSVFLGEPAVNPALIRALAQMAGAHVWSFGDDVVHVRPPFLTVHASQRGQRALAFPQRWSAAHAITREWAAVNANLLKIDLNEGATANYLVGTKDGLQSILDADLEALAKVDGIPPRESNVRQDVSNFEVPVVKLNEWTLESDEGDELADEWFLRPAAVAEDKKILGAIPVTEASSDETTRTGRRRNRRGDRNDRGGREDREPRSLSELGPVETVALADDSEMGFVFRKRD